MRSRSLPKRYLVIPILLICSLFFLPLGEKISSADVAQPARLLSGPDLAGQAVAAGTHACGIKSDGTLLCWGRNDYNQTDVPAGSYTQVSTGNYHTCGLKGDGTLLCWGRNNVNQIDVPAGTYLQVSAGAYHTCGLQAGGVLVCWGNPAAGTVPAGTYAQVSAGNLHSCGLKTDGTIVCWGDNDKGQTDVPAGTYNQVSAGGWHSCGLQGDGTAVCWGPAFGEPFYYGQTDVPPGSYTQVSAGWGHTCGLEGDGTVDCWGYNDAGQTDVPAGTYSQVSAWLSNTCAITDDDHLICWGPDTEDQTQVPARTFTQISAGNGHTCAIENDGSLHCWGHNNDGQTTVPAGIYSWVSAGENFTCALTDTGIAACWGLDDDGQSSQPGGTFSDISAGTDHACAVMGGMSSPWATCWGSSYGYTPNFPGSDLFAQISAGSWFTCGLRTNGTLYCWGLLPPAPPAGTYTQVSAGYNHACALSGTSISCWGDDDYNQSTVPAGTYTQVSAGHLYTCGLLTDHSIDCWGYNGSGETDVPPGNYGQISTGGGHACALTVSGYPVCWGEDTYNEATVPDFFYTYGLDSTPPAVVSSLRQDGDPTSAATVDYEVTFSEYVTGVDISDFGVQTTIGLGASVTGVVGAGDTYTVTVDTGTGNGTLRLEVLDDNSIRDAVNLPLSGGYVIGDTYTVDKSVILFEDDFETGDFSLWTRFNDGNGYLYPCTNAAINGTWGACVDRGTDKRKQLIDETPADKVVYGVRFNIDLNSLWMEEGSRFRFMQVKMGAERPFFIVLKREAGQYLIQLNTLKDDLTKVKSGWYLLTDAPHTLEVQWGAASGPGLNNGGAVLYLDGIVQEILSGLDSDTLYVDTFKIGFTSRLDDKPISGIFYLDDIATSNTGYIGPP